MTLRVAAINNPVRLPVFADLLKKIGGIKREIFHVGLGQVLALLGGVVGIKLLTRSLAPEEYGLLALGNSIAGFLVLFLYGPVSGVVARFFPVFREKQGLPTFFRLVGEILGWSTLIVLALTVPLAWFASAWFSPRWGKLLAMSMIYGVSVGWLASFQNIHNALRFRGVFAFHQGFDAWVRPLLAAALVAIMGPSGLWGILGFMAGSLLVNVSEVLFLTRNTEVVANWRPDSASKEERQAMRTEFWEYFYPFVFFSLSGWIISFADRWFLQVFVGAREVGVYSAVAQVAAIPILLIGSLSQFVMPILFERAGKVDSPERLHQTDRLLHLVTAFSLALMIGFLGLSVFFGDAIILALTSREYAGQGTLLWSLILAQTFVQIGNLLSFKGLYFNQAKCYIGPRLIQALVFVVLSLLLLPHLQIYGIVTSLAVSSMLVAFLIWRKNGNMSLVKSAHVEPAAG